MAKQLPLKITVTIEDVVECAVCAKPIVVRRFEDGKVTSEYRGRDGECFKCAALKRGNRG